MYISVLPLLWVLSKCAGDSCEISWYNFHCSDVTQENFVRESFRNEDDLKKNNIITIEIINSNFTVIDSFPKTIPFTRQNIQITELKLMNSQIENVSDTAFIEWESLECLDLSRNKINSISFLKYLPYTVSKVDLSYNELNVLDLNFVRFRRIFFSHNKIHSLKRIIGDLYLFDMIDLSFNKLVNFDLPNINSFSGSIDVSYNKLEKVVLYSDFYDSVNIMGNNISYLGSNDMTPFMCRNLFATNIPPVNVAKTQYALMMNGSKIGELDKEVLNLTELIIRQTNCYQTFIINLSNSSISAISQFFFVNICASEINLSHNNISSLVKSIFKNSNVKVINLAYSGIRTISEKTFEGVRECDDIILRGNFLKTVDNICKHIWSINSIDLSSNKIEKIHSDNLVGCNNLKFLDLSQNCIRYLQPGAFQSLRALREVDFSKNHITLGNSTISNLSRIEGIDLSNNDMEVFGTNAFRNLSLSLLELINNPVKVVKTKAFNDLYNLRVLNLSKIGIEVLEEHAFFDLPSIHTIDLTDNRISNIMSYTFSDIPVRDILLKRNQILTLKTRAFHSLPNLLFLDLSKQKIKEIGPFAFSNSSAENLDLRYNNINYIGGHIFRNVTIKRLYINENNVTKLSSFGNDVRIRELSLKLRGIFDKGAISNMYLEKLVLTNSCIEVMKNGSFDGAYNLNKLTFENTTVLSYEPAVLRNLFNLREVNISDLISNERKLKKYMFMDIGKLERITLSNLGLIEIENYTFFGLNSLKRLSLKGNHITKVGIDSFNGMKQLLFLDLSANEFILINLGFIKTLPNLETLDLSDNKIKQILSDSNNEEIHENLTTLYLNHNDFTHIKSETFLKLYKLKTLYLNDNGITHIDSDAFAQLENLKYLNLVNNIIRKVLPDTFLCQRHLEYLNLGNNSLEDIPLNSFQHLSILETLYLNHNHLNVFHTGLFNGPRNLKTLDISYNLHQVPHLFRFTPLRSLSGLVHLNLDQTGLLFDSDYSKIPIYYPHLEAIQINYNGLFCEQLLDMITLFDKINIYYKPQKPEYGKNNHFGIMCQDH